MLQMASLPCRSYFDTHRHGEYATFYPRALEQLDKVVELKAQTDTDLSGEAAH
jgi:hypothetical protein